jgi:hypothetical protein
MGTRDFAHETESGTVRPAARKELVGALSEGEKKELPDLARVKKQNRRTNAKMDFLIEIQHDSYNSWR